MGKVLFFFLSIHNRNRGGRTGATCRRRTAAVPGMAAAGSGGNGERRSRATCSCPHLGLGRLVEGDRLRRTVCNRGGLWRAAVGAQGREREVPGRCGARGERCWAVYRRGKAVSRPGSSTRSSCLPVNGG
jgi:hypothetical protein